MKNPKASLTAEFEDAYGSQSSAVTNESRPKANAKKAKKKRSGDSFWTRMLIFVCGALVGLGVFAQPSRCSGIYTWYVDDGLFGSIKHFTDMVEIATVIEMIAQHEILQVLVTIKLLVIVVSDRKEPSFVFHSENWDAISSEVTTCHGYDMTC